MKKSFISAKNVLDRLTIKDIPGYEGIYGISNCGVVISYGGKSNHKDAIILKPNFDKDGYKRVSLSHNKVKAFYRVCRLVAISFIPNPENKEYVNHKDEVKDNDSVDNLEWMTHFENWEYSCGSECIIVAKCDKTTGEVIETYKSLMEAGRQNGINQGNITKW